MKDYNKMMKELKRRADIADKFREQAIMNVLKRHPDIDSEVDKELDRLVDNELDRLDKAAKKRAEKRRKDKAADSKPDTKPEQMLFGVDDKKTNELKNGRPIGRSGGYVGNSGK